MLSCRVCGAQPAANVTIYQHTGMIVMMQMRHAKGPFCRRCGMALVKRYAGHTALFGWWGVISLFLGTPITLLLDLFAWLKLRGLDSPQALARTEPGFAPAHPAPWQPGYPTWDGAAAQVPGGMSPMYAPQPGHSQAPATPAVYAHPGYPAGPPSGPGPVAATPHN